MARVTETLTMPIAHVYHLTSDPANDTGYTMEEITKMMEEHGGEKQIEITITHPIPDISEEPAIDVTVTEESIVE